MLHSQPTESLQLLRNNKASKYKNIYDVYINYSSCSFNKKYNGHFYNLLNFCFTNLNIEILKKINISKSLKFIKNKFIFIKYIFLIKLIKDDISKNILLNNKNHVRIFYNLFSHLIFSNFQTSVLNFKFINIIRYYLQKKTPTKFLKLFSMFRIYFSILVLKNNVIHNTINWLKKIKIFFNQFIVLLKKINKCLHFSVTETIKHLKHYVTLYFPKNSKTKQKLIFKNINLKLNTFFLIKYIERLQKIKYILTENKKKHKTFIVIKFKSTIYNFRIDELINYLYRKKFIKM
uniref:Uncharacterized protein n=1 Tax=Lotharella vacuolata TaxID=74820 RepID=A0A0H5BKA7_9EUKA|nr:hypothetical protein [Lotharella vacuolata]